MDPTPPTCSLCGAGPDDGCADLPLTWSTGTERGRTQVFCADCSRRHLRAIEGKLDSEWW